MHTMTRASLVVTALAMLLVVGVILAPAAWALDRVDWAGTDISNSQAQMLVWAGIDYNHPTLSDFRSVGEQQGNDYSSGAPPNFWQLRVSVQKHGRANCSAS